MPNAVVILGAGASADFGVPTLRNIFKDPYARSYLGMNAALQKGLDELFWGPRGHTVQTSDESLTIEEMLTVLRDWEREDGVPKPDKTYFGEFRRNLYHLIYHAVFCCKSSRAAHLNPLIGLLGAKLDRITWASFNWDCIFEASFWHFSGGPGPYGGRYNPNLAVNLQGWRNGGSKHEYLKLHGSVNWWVIEGQLSYLSFGPQNQLQQKWADYCHGGRPNDYPVILEPSAYKYTDEVYKHLECQWQTFFQRLCEADCVLIVGYSLPDIDVQARSKILSAFQANTNAKWLVVDPTADICRRYRRLLGQRRVTVLEMGLAGFNNDLRHNLRSAFDNVDFSEPPPPAAVPASG